MQRRDCGGKCPSFTRLTPDTRAVEGFLPTGIACKQNRIFPRLMQRERKHGAHIPQTLEATLFEEAKKSCSITFIFGEKTA
jgi:hypothetical protein